MADSSALLRQAVQLHQQGRLEQAKGLYQQVLAQQARHFDALHLLGVIERQQGHPERAAELIEAALQIDPDQARAHCNLGAALQDLGRPEAALASYEHALRLDPQYALAWDNRGNTLRRLGRQQEALEAYERALLLKPAYPEAWCHRAIVMQDLGRFADAAASAERALAARPGYVDALLALGNALQALERQLDALAAYDQALALAERADVWCARGAALKKSGQLVAALASYDQALRLRPDYALAAHYRANVLRALGRVDAARSAYRRALALGADAVDIRFALAALGEGEVPAAAPAAYVKDLFDQYAGHFDRHLVEVLGYRTPLLLGELLDRHGQSASGASGQQNPLDVLDLGCGTGLCAPILRPLARTLTGVDLSEKMLDKARELRLYDDLACADIVEWLHGRQAQWDLVMAADVFVYIGDLAPVFGRVRAALRDGGLFAFSCESTEGDGYAITPSNRYAHAPAYVQAAARAAGFEVLEKNPAVLRREHDADVAGQLVLLRAAR
jgi:predicted TPR repeat methyltransferase